jgi:hypothetical protein
MSNTIQSSITNRLSKLLWTAAHTIILGLLNAELRSYIIKTFIEISRSWSANHTEQKTRHVQMVIKLKGMECDTWRSKISSDAQFTRLDHNQTWRFNNWQLHLFGTLSALQLIIRFQLYVSSHVIKWMRLRKIEKLRWKKKLQVYIDW